MIDLRSDTVTRPTAAMHHAMFDASVGDDVFGEDPTVNALQERIAAYFGHEAALFCPSGTMTNQIAIRVHTRPGDEVICAGVSHVYLYEGGGIARNSGASVRLVKGDRGRLSAADVLANINSDDAHLARTRLVSLEDTVNKGGGCCYELDDIIAVSSAARSKNLGVHLDGARLFNALVHKGHNPVEYGRAYDSISVCFSKGLGCPVGSAVIGSKDFIHEAHRVRKTFGGGMRQAGYLAGAVLHALDHHVDRMAEDHARAHKLAAIVQQLPEVSGIMPVETNIVIFELADKQGSAAWVEAAKTKGILAVPFGPDKVRFVTHLDINDADVTAVERALLG